MRCLARECVFKYIFSRLFNQNDEGLFDVLLEDKNLNSEDKIFARQLLAAIDVKTDFYLNEISELSEGYKLNRIFNADKCAIIIGMAEYDNFSDTPVAVIIDQAVNIAAKFSTERSTDFVNGVLAKYVKKYSR